ncbi:hypothetical protein Slala03_74400 [Streptomyces lavendulae subsp. lavendulae]|nr:hypothetical protein Slala03_74400 [Streptomyces lavendulae subsp. lavendulae]
MLWLAEVTSCGTPAGTHRARVLGNTQVRVPAATVSVPVEAHANWCVWWVCRWNCVPGGMECAPTTSALPCLLRDIT